jgi:hypothetical protein
MEAVSTSETSVSFFQTTGPYNLEDSHVHSRRPENLNSQLHLSALLFGKTGQHRSESLGYAALLFRVGISSF